MAPFLLEDPRVHDMFPGDAIARAREYLVHVKGGVGAYSDSKGNPHVRQEVCCACFFFFYIMHSCSAAGNLDAKPIRDMFLFFGARF